MEKNLCCLLLIYFFLFIFGICMNVHKISVFRFVFFSILFYFIFFSYSSIYLCFLRCKNNCHCNLQHSEFIHRINHSWLSSFFSFKLVTTLKWILEKKKYLFIHNTHININTFIIAYLTHFVVALVCEIGGSKVERNWVLWEL